MDIAKSHVHSFNHLNPSDGIVQRLSFFQITLSNKMSYKPEHSVAHALCGQILLVRPIYE